MTRTFLRHHGAARLLTSLLLAAAACLGTVALASAQSGNSLLSTPVRVTSDRTIATDSSGVARAALNDTEQTSSSRPLATDLVEERPSMTTVLDAPVNVAACDAQGARMLESAIANGWLAARFGGLCQ